MYLVDNSLSQAETKWIADIVIYNLLGKDNNEFKSLTNISLDMTKGDILKYYKMNLRSKIDVEEFERNYYRLETEYKFKGEQAVWEKYNYIEDYVRKELKYSYRLYGEYLEQQTIIKVKDVITKIDISKWDYTKFPSMWGLVGQAFAMHIVHKDKKGDDLRSDIATNKSEGKDFTVSVEEVHTVKGSLQDLYHDKEFYSKTMEDVYKASKYLFTDDSRGRSNLDILYFSIFNQMMLEDAEEVKEKLKNRFPSISITRRAEHPIKFEYKKNGGHKWGHLPHIDSSYESQEPGNESIINSILKDGKRVLKSLNKIMSNDRLMKSNRSVYFAQVCSELINNFTICVDSEGKAIVEENLKNKLTPRSIQEIINGIHCASRVKDVIEASGRRFMCFPAVELRQRTWNRFSTYHELMTYHRIHENLGNLMRRPYKYNIGETNVSGDRLLVEEVKGIPPEVLILEEVSKHSLNLKFTTRDAVNKKTKIPDTGEKKLYGHVINQLIDLNIETSEPLRYLKNNSQLSGLIGLILDLTKLSLMFFYEVPENYRIRSNMRQGKLRVPELGSIVQVLHEINNKHKVVDDEEFQCRVFTQEIASNISLPRKVLKQIQDTHEYIYGRIYEVFKDQGLGYALNNFNGEHCRANLHGALNIHLGNRIQSTVNKILKEMLRLGGQEVKNGSIVRVSNYTDVIEGVVSLIGIEEVLTVMRCKTVDEFVKVDLFEDIQERFQIPGRDLKAYCVIVRAVSRENTINYNKLREVVEYYFNFNTELNMRNNSLKELTTIPFERDMRTLSHRFDTYAYKYPNYRMNIKDFNVLEAYVYNSQLSLLGLDGGPYITEDEVNGGFWVYSSLALKTKYPATNNEIEIMSDFDIDRYLDIIGTEQEER